MNDLNRLQIEEALTFDDVQLIPKYSEILSREDVETSTKLTKNYNISIPLVAAPMDTVTDVDLAYALWKEGGIGIVHRFMSSDEQATKISQLRDEIDEEIRWGEFGPYPPKLLGAAIGVGRDFERITNLLEAGTNILVIDVAHGHHFHVKKLLEELKQLKLHFSFDVIAGSIATTEAAQDLEEWGADALRVGVGGGSVCETRIRTGIGIPQLQAVLDIAQVATVPIISDGGIRYPGDVAKALAAGADSVMIGSLFAGTDEAPGDIFVDGEWPNTKKLKVYRGLASATTKLKYSGAAQHVEGASKMIECKGPIRNIVGDIIDGLKSSMSYVGAKNLEEFRTQSKFIRITPAGVAEGHPHLLR